MASLNRIGVESINEYLVMPGTVFGDPHRLAANANLSFHGTILLGDGFLMSPEEANDMIKLDTKNTDVLFPCLNGKDLNTNPSHEPSRWCVNFFDWDMNQAMSYARPWSKIQTDVMPYRQRKKENGEYKTERKAAEIYWLYLRPRIELKHAISSLERVMAIARTSKVVMPVWVPSNWVYYDACVIFAFDDDHTFGVLSSQFHWWWTLKYTSTLKTDVRYAHRRFRNISATVIQRER